MLIKCGNEHVHPYKRDSLRVLGCGKIEHCNISNIHIHACRAQNNSTGHFTDHEQGRLFGRMNLLYISYGEANDNYVLT